MVKQYLNIASRLCSFALASALITLVASARAEESGQTIRADVVALDQPFMLNRLGASLPQGMIFALKRDVVPINPARNPDGEKLSAGNVMLRQEKRPRPIVLRVNMGQYLEIHFTNLLSPVPKNVAEPSTRYAGVHVNGLELVQGRGPNGASQPGINSDATWVGANENGLAAPGETKIYKYYAKEEGTFLLYSAAGDWGGQLASGLFGAVNVEPKEAEWYRSQVTYEDLHSAAYFVGKVDGRDNIRVGDNPDMTIRRRPGPDGRQVTAEVDGENRPVWTLTTVDPDQQTVHMVPVVIIDERLSTLDARPLVNYNAVYPQNHSQAGTPILNMLQKEPDGTLILVHSDLTAIITGPNAGRFPYNDVSPTFNENPTLPDRRQPYREFTIHYHEVFGAVQAFSQFYDPELTNTMQAGVDAFAINYGAAGIGAEVLANRLGVGPMGNRDAVDLKFEEFFLSAWAAGDPAMVVDVPANAPNQVVSNPAQGSQVEQQLQFNTEWVQHLDTHLLDQGKIPDYLKNAFQGHNIPLSDTAQVSAAAPGSYWVITDPNNSNTPASNRARFPIQVQIDPFDPTLSRLQIFSGFPVTPTAQSFNSLARMKATKAFYPDDPSNVYHSYMRDHVKMRILHSGGGITHIHHLHAHQWLHSPNSDNSAYLDSQMINPGATYTLEMVYNGSGNRNQTVGDSIFHCHFYPHFAGGMWGLWRVHDVFEAGSRLDKEGRPVSGTDGTGRSIWNRALPDGEIETGTPIPAVVPLPTLAMAPAPAAVRLVDNGRRVQVEADTKPDGEKVYKNPGYPFFIPAVAGHRAPQPPLDFAWEEEATGHPKLTAFGKKIYLDGGLPRHLILDGKVVREFHTRWDFTKEFVAYDKAGKPVDGGLVALELPEEGTAIEQTAMAAHSERAQASYQSNGDPGNFILNGLPPVPGAPYANPSVDDYGNANINTRRYQGAAIQMDVVFNKKGWHFPQQRFLTLWEDVKPTVKGERPPQPFFFRANTGETVEFWHTNLVPDYYELDDFQVRTPTDVLGQHIHLVKFDVTSSDGAANGFNYEDGTLSPNEVRKRIDAINLMGGLYEFDPGTQFKGETQKILHAKPAPRIFGDPPAYQNWTGAQTTVQLWDTDPLLNNKGKDRTMRTVFTHDHFSPSTHQQIGLYGGLLIEPEGSEWYDPVSGERLYNTTDWLLFSTDSRSDAIASLDAGQVPVSLANEFEKHGIAMGAKAAVSTEEKGVRWIISAQSRYPVAAKDHKLYVYEGKRNDGGPTGWQANIVSQNKTDSYREFALEFGDFQLAYTKESPSTPGIPASPLFTTDSALTSQLPTDAQPVPVPADLQNAFSRNGITLSSAAVIRKPQEGQWVITDSGVPDEGEEYVLREQNQSLEVFTPKIDPGWSAAQSAINPPPLDPNNSGNSPYPTLISVVAPPGTYSLNYRNEPLPLRVWNPVTNQIPGGIRGDLSYAFSSIEREDPDLNQQPIPGTPINSANPDGFKFPPNLVPTVNGPQPSQDSGSSISQMGEVQPYDPFTPLLRAYANDKIQIRTLVGSQHNPHYFTVQGVKWFFEPSYTESGYRNDQAMGISEHFEMLFDLPAAATTSTRPFADYLYEASSGTDGLTNGLWGILRAYDRRVDGLVPLPNNPPSPANVEIKPPPGVTPKTFQIVATTAAQALPQNSLIYNSRGQVTAVSGANEITLDKSLLIEDPYALIYVRAEDLTSPDAKGKLKPGVPIEPLILRANAGDWIEIKLTNAFDPGEQTFDLPTSALPPFGSPAPTPTPALAPINLKTSQEVGLHAQLVSYDVTTSNGVNVGFNPVVTVKARQTSEPIYWYAGNLYVKDGKLEAVPVELGSINLVPSDPLQQHTKGLVGALIVEPKGAAWKEDINARASATVTKADGSKFREFVIITQNDVTLYSGKDKNGPVQYGFSSSTVNYGSEPMPYRYPLQDGQFQSSGTDVTAAASDQQVQADPQTPVFVASAGSPVRFRMLHPASGPGNPDGEVMTVSGHVWQEEPYVNNSQEIGYNPLSQWLGSRGQHGAGGHFEIVLDSAGGKDHVPGDYLYRSLISLINGGDTQAGLWGIFRVSLPGKDAVVITKAEAGLQELTIEGVNTVNPDTGDFAQTVQLFGGALKEQTNDCTGVPFATVQVDQTNGHWKFTGPIPDPRPASACARSSYGGVRSVALAAPPAAAQAAAVPEVRVPQRRVVPESNILRLFQRRQKENWQP